MRATPHTPQAPRRKRLKGKWMRLQNPDLLARYMENANKSQSCLARHAQCSRQFIHMLLTGERRSCTKQIALLIEESLHLLPGTLFVEEMSPTTATVVARKRAVADVKRRATAS